MIDSSQYLNIHSDKLAAIGTSLIYLYYLTQQSCNDVLCLVFCLAPCLLLGYI